MSNQLNMYLEKIENYLKRIPVIERTDIIKEIQSTIVEMQNDGLSDSQIIERLGDAKALAAAYYGEALTKDNSFSLSRVKQVIGFYSLVGLTGVIVIPTLAIVSVAFIGSGYLTIILGIIDSATKLLNIKIPVQILYFAGYTPNALISLLICIAIGVILIIWGKAAWKSLLKYINYVSNKYQKLSN